MSDKPKIEISDVCEKALDDLSKVEFQFTVEEINMKGVSGSVVLHLDKSGTTH